MGDDGKRAAAAHLVEDFLGHGLSLQKGSGRFFRRPERYSGWLNCTKKQVMVQIGSSQIRGKEKMNMGSCLMD